MHHSIWIWMRMADFDPCMWGSVVILLKVGQKHGLATADAGAWQRSRHRHTWMRPVRHAWRKQCSISNVSQLKSVVVQLSSNLTCPSNFKLQSKISLIDLFKCRSLRYAAHTHSIAFSFILSCADAAWHPNCAPNCWIPLHSCAEHQPWLESVSKLWLVSIGNGLDWTTSCESFYKLLAQSIMSVCFWVCSLRQW